MKTYKINVTQRDIDNGKRSNWECCPIAKAVRRQTPFKKSVVGMMGVYKSKKASGSTLIARFPEEAKCFVDLFDSRRRVRPFTFKLSFE